MPQVRIRPGKTTVTLTSRGRALKIPKALAEVPGGLYPLMSAAFEVDEYRIMSGWPVPVPEGDIRIDCLVSAEGDVLGNRNEPTSLLTGADMRWVADSSYYDQTSLQWAPIQGEVSPWQTSVEQAPTLITDYEYRLGDERFVGMTALNFDSNTADYMWNNLDLAMGGTKGYTVIMVMCPNSIYGNDDSVEDNALWGPDATTGNWSLFTVKDQAVFCTTESAPAQRGVPIANGLASSAPTFLALVVGRPETRLYAASGPSNVQSKALATGEAPVELSTRFWLGDAPFSSSATMDMALLDLGIYGNLLTRSEVVAEFKLLSEVYGGDS